MSGAMLMGDDAQAYDFDHSGFLHISEFAVTMRHFCEAHISQEDITEAYEVGYQL